MIEGLDSDIAEHLKQLAWEQSEAFCYNDYIKVPKDKNGNTFCPKCGSDDLMRILPYDGPEYGIEWVMEAIIQQEWKLVSSSDIKKATEDFIDELYPDGFEICGGQYYASDILKNCSPGDFEAQVSEYQDRQVEDGYWVEVGNSVYVVPEDMK